MDEENRKFNAKDRQKFFRVMLRELRSYPSLKSFLPREVDFHNLFDTIELLDDGLKFESRDTVLEWISFAEKDLNAYRLLYQQAPGLALYHLQQTVEKLVKSLAIFYGINTEEEVRQYNHDTAKFFVNFFESDLMQAIKEKYPFRHPQKSDMEISPESFNELSALSEARLELSEEILNKIFDLDSDIPTYLETLNEIQPLFTLGRGRKQLDEMLRETMGVILEQEFDKFISKHEKQNLVELLLLHLQSIIGLTYILLFFSFVTPIWESAGRYPDEKKRVFRFRNMDYQDTNLIKSADLIIVNFKRYIATYKELVSKTGE